jgi:hypothetical protein
MFITKPKVALHSNLHIATETEESQPILTSLLIIRDDAFGRLITDPKEVIAQVQMLET